jgi:type I restriction enzyme S subunit
MALGELGEFIRGNGLQKSDLTEDGTPAIHYGQIHTHYGISTDSTKSYTSLSLAAKLRRAKPGDLVIATTSEDDASVAKATAWLGDGEVVVSGDAHIYRHSLDPRYIAYFFQSEHFQRQKIRHISGTKVRRISGASLAKIRIPVPALEVQQEISRILDRFAELRAELEMELEARRRQYGYYRGQLLAKSNLPSAYDCKVSEISVSLPSPRGVKRSDYGLGSLVPIIDQGQSWIAGYTDDVALALPIGEYVIFGDHTRAVKWADFSFAAGADGTKILQGVDGVLTRYLYHVISTLEIPSRGYNRHWTVLRDMQVPVPPLVEQERVLAILDKFDVLVNDVSVGLPAEIAARRKQYEYYRDRLFAFKELVT